MAAKKASIMDILNQRSKEKAEAEKNAPEKEESTTQKKLYIDIYNIIPEEKNFYNTEKDLDWLKWSIELQGLIEPLVVTPDGNGKYKLVSGHRRRLALLELVKEGKERFRDVECSIRDKAITETEEIMNRLAMIMANGYRDKSDWERMTEAVETEALVLKLKEQMNIKGRTRDLLAEIIGSKPAQVGRYKAIYNNLSEELMELFREEKVGVSAIYEASGLGGEWQKKAYEEYKKQGELSLNDIARLKRLERDAQGVPGQMSMTKEQERQPESEEATETEPEEETGLEEQGKEEYFEPEPETLTSICYSCDRYEECHEKKATVRQCNAYIDREEARKTEEQRYAEEQAKIDTETRKKLREQEQEEKMDNLPSDTHKQRDIRLARSQYEEIESGALPFLLLKKDNFSVGEELTLPEYADGKETGRTLKLKITYIMDDRTGLDDGYCIIGFWLMSCATTAAEEAGTDTAQPVLLPGV